ncbi:SDH family Clp fold serine proteinase [Terribacillus saccharophilus]|uniref:SDH family Clp fold serine proteinase n=1 Tax=Terribacillus saccharophilus TaxID=361277 RepID=UPI003D286BE7
MPSNHEVREEIATVQNPDVVRRKYTRLLSEYTGRNTIIYYSGWLQKQVPREQAIHVSVNDTDMNGFMTTISGLDESKGLDLILHTPGGDIAATEALVNYLKSIFGKDIRAIVPQLAMSAGTMISCACNEIVMGKHSSIGPIDPQINGMPAHGIIQEFERARNEIALDAKSIPLWQPIIAKYTPSLIGHCVQSIDLSMQMVKTWLMDNMLSNNVDPSSDADKILSYLGSYTDTKSHGRHIPKDVARNLGLKITDLESDKELQDLVLSIHHATILTLGASTALKIIENQEGVALFHNM